ncbi:hypothetical protein L1887_32436 [Cichorium endivia]|nr:hypothetical protein L1887_32436 [Cichorium endivia]
MVKQENTGKNDDISYWRKMRQNQSLALSPGGQSCGERGEGKGREAGMLMLSSMEKKWEQWWNISPETWRRSIIEKQIVVQLSSGAFGKELERYTSWAASSVKERKWRKFIGTEGR